MFKHFWNRIGLVNATFLSRNILACAQLESAARKMLYLASIDQVKLNNLELM